MKKLLFPALLLLLFFSPLLRRGAGGEVHGQFASQNINLLANWDTSITIAESYYGIRYNSVWGWVDPQDNKEYAILGSTDGTYFFDLTDPLNPVMRDYVKGRRDSCIWREYKDYQGYLYAVSDDAVDANNQNSLQIIDMSYLPDSVHVAYDSDTLFYRAHTVFIDGNKMYCGYVHGYNKSFSMAVYSLANPVAPSYLRDLNQDDAAISTVHDMFVRNDTVYASCGNEALHIYKFNANNTFTQIGSLTNYANFGQGYNHSSALTADGNTLIFADEVPANLPVKSVDVSNFGNITVLDTFRSTYPTIATPHNIYIQSGSNTRVTVAYYQDGVQIFDISNPANVTRTGFFDTAPLDCQTCPTPDYSGCWGAFVDLPSGLILASDMQNGLFVLKSVGALDVQPVTPGQAGLQVFPNPFTQDVQVNLSLVSGENISVELSDITGKLVLKKQLSFGSGNSAFTISGRNLDAGTYLLNVKGESFSKTEKIIKTNK